MADHDSLGGRRLGEFVLRTRIGEGGFGAVYLCDQPLLSRQAVVKVLHTRRQSHDTALLRFSREALLASRLDHPYAAHIYGCGVENDGLLWIAMELVQGITLRDWLQARGTLSLEEFVPLFECVAAVVQAAHERGIVHRDLKPSNIMVVELAGQRLPKLLDFGIAKLLGEAGQLDGLDSSLSQESAEPDPDSTAAMRKGVRAARRGPRRLTGNLPIGSPQYMAPEQWTEPATVGPAADLYALGIIAYETLSGRPPFDVPSTSTDKLDELAELHCSAPIPPVGIGSTPGLERFFQRALAKRPEDRFATALELASALRTELEAQMVARISAAAKQWRDRGRAPELLWRGSVLAELEQWAQRSASAGTLSGLDLEFTEACKEQEAARVEQIQRRVVWRRRLGWGAAVAAVAGVFVGFQLRAAYRADTAEQIAAATAIQAEIDEGRSALLHDDLVEAEQHLAEAVRRGDRSPATMFMLARASQPLRAEQARFAARSGRMWSAAWSPDGARLVTTDDSAAQIWDTGGHRLVATLLHNDTVHDAVFSRDGQLVVTAGRDGTTRLWRARDGAAIRTLRAPRGAPRYFLAAMSPDGRLVAAIDVLGTVVHVWDVNTGALLTELPGAAREWPTLAFSPDGMWLATGSGNGIQVYDSQRWTIATSIAGSIRAIAWDPTGLRLMSGAASGDASIWMVPSGARTAHLREVGEPVDAVAWSQDGKLTATASRDGTEQVWSAATNTLVSQSNHVHEKIFGIEFDPASRLLVAAGANGMVAISDAATGMPVSLLEGPTKLVRTAHFDPAGQRVLGASWDGTARVWDASSPYRRWSAEPLADDCGVVTSLEPDRRVVAIPCRERATRVWDTSRGSLLAELSPSSALPAVSAGGDRAAIARGDTVELYELPGGRLLRSIQHGAAVTAVAFAAVGRDLISGSADGTVLVARDGYASITLPPMPRIEIDAVALLADDRALVADARGRVRVIAGGVVVAELEAASRIGLLRPSPGGNRLIGIPAVTATAAPMLWDLTSYRSIRPLEGHLGLVLSARWVDSNRFLTAGQDGSAHMWDSTGAALVSYRGSTRYLTDVALSPDGQVVVGGGADGRLRFWEAATGRPLWTTRAHTGALVGIHYEGEDVITRGLGGDVVRWRLSAK